MKTIIRNGTVVTFDSNNPLIEPGYVSIGDDGRISTVESGSGERQAREASHVVDARGGLILPGLINAHMHAYSTFARGMTPPGPEPHNFLEVLEGLWWQLDRTLELEDCYWSTLVPAIEAVRRGTTTFIDHHASPHAVEGSLERVEQALSEVGMRGVLCYEVSDRDGMDVRDAGLEENERAIERFRDRDQFGALLGLHASFTLGEESLRRASDIVERNETGVHIHVAEGRNDEPETMDRYGNRIVPRLHEHGLLHSDSILAHCIHVNEEEMDLIARTGANVVHNPTSNMNNAVGAAPIPAMLEKGITVGLGTDGMSGDPWTDLRCVSHLQNHAAEDPSTSFDEGVRMLTQNNPAIASQCLGIPVGRLKEGAAGDVITLDYDPPTPLTEDNFAGHFLFGCREDQVRNTVVNGDVILDNNQLVTVDEGRVMNQSRERARALWKRLHNSA